MLSSFLFVRHPFLGPVGSRPPGQTGRQAGVPTIPPAKENDFRQGCISLLLRGSIWRCRGSLWRSLATLSTAFPIVWPIETASAFAFPPCLCLYACVPAGTRAGGLAGRLARMPARKQAGVPTVSPAKKGDFLKGCIPLLLRGSIWRCRGSLWRSLPGLIAIFFAF